MIQVSVTGIKKNFGALRVLDDISLDVGAGEFLSLVGPSGCGKSTLLRIIAGLEEQDAGHVRLGARIVDEVRPSARNLSMVFQSYALYPHLTVADNIAVPLRMRELTWLQRQPLVRQLLPSARRGEAAIARKVRDVAELLSIAPLLGRKPRQLSGGQRQRVAVGRAIVREPVAFLLDEPLSNLDAKLRVHMRAEITALHRKLGATFIYVTHDQAEAMTMSDRIALMMDGRIVQCDRPSRIYNAPANIGVAEFIGSPKINLIPGGAVGHRDDVTFGVRPEAMHLAGRGETSDVISITGVVTHVENHGSEAFVHLAPAWFQGTDEGSGAPIVVRTEPADLPSVGDDSMAAFDPSRVLTFDQTGRAIADSPPPPRKRSEPSVSTARAMAMSAAFDGARHG